MPSTPSPNSTDSHTSSFPPNFVLPNSGVGPALTRGQSIRDHIITRTDSSHSRYRMSVFLQLVVGLQTNLVPFYLKFWGWGWSLHRSCAGYHSFFEFLYTTSDYVLNTVLSWYYQPPLLLIIFLHSLPWRSLGLIGREEICISNLRLNTPSYFLHI